MLARRLHFSVYLQQPLKAAHKRQFMPHNSVNMQVICKLLGVNCVKSLAAAMKYGVAGKAIHVTTWGGHWGEFKQ